MLNCKDEIAPLFYTDSVADLKDIFVFAEDMTNEDEEKQALAEGMLTLKMGAAQHVLNGITSISEMKKITYETGDEY